MKNLSRIVLAALLFLFAATPCVLFAGDDEITPQGLEINSPYFSIFPNPVLSGCPCYVNAFGYVGYGTCRVSHITGILVAEVEGEFPIALPGLSPGIYYVNVYPQGFLMPHSALVLRVNPLLTTK